jgi:hypothetical protein
MSVGLPGTGVGGLFYLLSALAMPVRELVRAARGRSCPRSRLLAARQGAIGAGVAGGIWVTGWLIGVMLKRSPVVREAVYGIRDLAAGSSNVVKMASVLLAFTTLVLVIGGVEIAAWCQSAGRRRRAREVAGSRLRGRRRDRLAVQGSERPAA